MRRFLSYSWTRRALQNRVALFMMLAAVEFQFFTINLLNTHLRDPRDGWELRFAPIDGQLTPNGIWLIPYFVGFFFALLVPFWSMFHMPIRLYRQFVLAVVIAGLISYVVYLVFPTYVVKPAPEAVPGSDFFARMLRRTYEADAAASSHNAAPSQHVFYALLNMCFMIRFRPRPRVFWTWVPVAALICASTLTTMRHNSPDLLTGYLVAVIAYYGGVALGGRVTDHLDDDNDPIVVPGRAGRLHRRIVSYRHLLRRRVSADTSRSYS